MRGKIIALILVVLALACLPTSAQTSRGLIRGRVTDSSGDAIFNAAVRLTSESSGDVRAVTSGPSGDYTFSLLPPGPYRLEVEHGGHKRHVQRIELRVNQEFRADIALEPGNLVEEISIVAPRTPLKKDSASIGTAIENRKILGLPLDGRNFYELTLLVPGAVPAAQGSAGSVRGEFAFSVNGAREDSNFFLLDGAFNVDPKLNSVGVRPPVDAIHEFEILTSTYDASFGRNPGAQVNVVLKSGTNRLHGSAFEFFRNAALDARNFFAPPDQPDPKYQRNQFGFALGGPLVRNRTFFFADYEGTRVREGITRVSNVPTLAERAGDFSASLFPRPIDPFTQQPFAGGVIPPQRINAIGRAIAALYPEQNRPVPFQNFVSSPTLRDRNDAFDVRVNHALSASSELTARYSFGDRDLLDPFSGPTFAAVPGFGTRVPRRSQNAMLSETRIFSPRLVNEARIAFSRVSSAAIQESQGTSLNRQVGLPEVSSNPRDFGLSFITVTGFSPLGDEFNNPQDSVTNVFQVSDNASYARGAHLLKFGFDFRYLQQNAFRDVLSRGFLTFSNQGMITGNALADLLLGFPLVTGVARLDNHQHLRTESYNFYVNDSVRVTPSLTISAGLRYEYNSPPVDVDDRANIYDPVTQSIVRVGTAGIPRSGYESDRNNFAPRVGLAWTVREKTVLRAGYGIYYDQSSLAPGEGLYFNPPFFDFNLFFSLPGLPLTLNDPFPAFFPFALPDSALTFQRDLRTAYMQHWSAGVQQQFGTARLLEISYVGSKGTKLLTARDINQPAPSPFIPNPRPVPQFDDINAIESRANSIFNSLQVRFQQRMDFGLSLLTSYTWSKSIDNASNFFSSAGDPNFPQNSNDVAAERGLSNFDVRHRLSVSYTYDLPFGRGRAYASESGWLSSFLTGWQTAGILTLQSGRPFTVALLPEIDISNTGRSSLGFGANDRPNVVGDPRAGRRSPDQWFNPAAFAFPAFGTFGDAGRNILTGPDFRNFNASLLKNTALREDLTLQFRVEAFNLFNRPNFDLPDNFLGSPTFGRIQSAQSPRHIQLAVKLVF